MENDQRRPPRWNWVSFGAPFIGYLSGILAAGIAERIWPTGHSWTHEFKWFIWTCGAFSVTGLVAAGIAIYRKERLWGLTVSGLILNMIVPLGMVYFFLAEVLSWYQVHSR